MDGDIRRSSAVVALAGAQREIFTQTRILGCEKNFLVGKFPSKNAKFGAEKSLFWKNVRGKIETSSIHNLCRKFLPLLTF